MSHPPMIQMPDEAIRRMLDDVPFEQAQDAGDFFFTVWLPVMLAFALVNLALLAFWLWMLVDAIRNPRLDDTRRIIWVVVIAVLNWVGALIYLLAGRYPSAGQLMTPHGRQTNANESDD